MENTQEVKRKSAVEIINETVEYYSADPVGRRGYDEIKQNCYYITEDGKMCAFGRCCIDPHGISTTSICEDEIEMEDGSYKEIEDLLKEEYRGHNHSFWYNLQKFHDDKDNWVATGLSEQGQKNVT